MIWFFIPLTTVAAVAAISAWFVVAKVKRSEDTPPRTLYDDLRTRPPV